MRIFNAFPIVSSKPKILSTPAARKMLALNDDHIRAAVRDTDLFILGFGANMSDHVDRYEQLRELLRGVDTYALDVTDAGLAKHPLYISYDAPLTRYTWPNLV
jgi:hypothetical protein